jgi:hypothetical protein
MDSRIRSHIWLLASARVTEAPRGKGKHAVPCPKGLARAHRTQPRKRGFPAAAMAMLPKPRGDTCYFPRDLTQGAFGGDVHCLQEFLAHHGYLLEVGPGPDCRTTRAFHSTLLLVAYRRTSARTRRPYPLSSSSASGHARPCCLSCGCADSSHPHLNTRRCSQLTEVQWEFGPAWRTRRGTMARGPRRRRGAGRCAELVCTSTAEISTCNMTWCPHTRRDYSARRKPGAYSCTRKRLTLSLSMTTF